ncbi:glycoside hydrolase family 26 protein [Rhizohabitans arisaemae]|uniref:glycoside hydrolase family 26 protein n=1 Tax=Rhizohabitans arisaemae TaxID=2720610 RepID=UPI0024B05C2F|nr:glycosyl hydrolase [Rhizohabitans arisaemae]
MPQDEGRHARPRRAHALLWTVVATVGLLVIAGGIYAVAANRDRVLLTLLGPGNTQTEAHSSPLPSADPSCRPSAKLVPPCGAWWGMYVPPAAGGSLRTAVLDMEQRIGRKLDLLFTYHDMSSGTTGNFLRDDEPELGEDRLLLLGWESSVWGRNTQIEWGEIASGALDGLIDAQARRVRDYGKPVFVGFDGEKDNDDGSSGTPEQYVAAYKRIVDRFRAAGADNAVWVWGVTGYYPYRDRWKPLYPGHDYVDWISYDPYNFARCRNAPWQDFEQTVKPTYDWFQANGFAEKPLMIAEYGSESDPRDPAARANWYRDIPQVLKRLPNIKAVMQWNSKDPDGCDFTLTGDGVLEAYAEAGRDPYVRQPLR